MNHYTFDKDVQFEPEELDCIYKDAFGYKTDGTFVEVGAYDGKSYSHTWGLAEIGWRGVYVEPVPRLASQCYLNHAGHERISVIHAAAGATKGEAEIFIDENCCCGSTMNPTVCKNPEKITVPMLTLDEILETKRIAPGFDLLSIDVEFAECEVLKGFNLGYWLPKLVIIELCEHHDEPKRSWAQPARDMCDQIFPANSYRKIFADWINTLYIHDPH